MNFKTLLLYISILDALNLIQLTSSDGIFHVKAIAGKQISIPCQTSDWDENEILLVLWYRENSAVPFYKLDSRNRQLFKAKHILVSVDLSNRFYFDVTTDPPVLKINPVLIEDETEYRCRVDYKKRRTQSFNTFLEVYGPPKEVKIMNTFGQTLEGLIGPYDEYTYVELICEASYGNPSPSLIWYLSGVLEVIIDNTYSINSTGVVRNELSLFKLNRKHYRTKMTCRASSNALYEPIDASVIIDMNLKPLSVEILTPNSPLATGIPAQFRCSSYGSSPTALMSWIIASENLSDAHNIELDGGNGTESMVSFVPTHEHHNQYLICRASNERVVNSTIEDKVLLNVEFEPKIDLSIDSSYRPPEDIEEGDTVRIICRVLANPMVDSIEWAFNGKLIKRDLFEDDQTLKLLKVNKNQAGKYQCTASNKIGKTTSKVVMLSVKFVPICKSGQQIYYNVIRNLMNRIQCSVEANPVDSSLKFKWFVNTSIEMFELKTVDRLEDDLRTTIANYRPKTVMNYAMVLCLAQNSVGIQREPCIFYLRIANGPPESVRSCEIINKSYSIISVECMSGNTGGLPQTFHLEVYSTLTEQLFSNHTSFQPNFIVDSLLPETLYNFVIYSSNEKGSSAGLTYHSVRLPKLEAQNKTQKDVTPLMNSFIGIVASIVIFCVIIAAIIRIRAFIYEDEYKVYENYNQNKRYSEDSVDIEETEQHNLMDTATDNQNSSGNQRLTSLKQLTNRLKATKCKAYEVTGVGTYTKHLENGASKKGVTFATFDEMPSDDPNEEYNERAIDVNFENNVKDEVPEESPPQTITHQIHTNDKPFKRKESNRRSKFFRKSFTRKTL